MADKPRTRKNITSIKKDSLEYNDLKTAFIGIMALDLDDENSFFNIAAYHGVTRNVCWHHHELFLNWHRKYVLKLENALRTIVPGISLPYFKAEDDKIPEWIFEAPFAGYTIPEDKTFQGIAARQYFDDFSLTEYTTNREYNTPAALARNLQTYQLPGKIELISDRHDWQLIAINGFWAPHDSIHVAIGGWMADPQLAAFDPLFWFHHSNVERWFHSWQISHNVTTRERINATIGQFSEHQIPWEMSFTDIETGIDPKTGEPYSINHGNSFPGDMNETVFYDFVSYDTDAAVTAQPPANALLAAGMGAPESGEVNVIAKYLIGVKVQRKNINGSFTVIVKFKCENGEKVSKFGVFQAGKSCENCVSKPTISVIGPVPQEVTFPAAVSVTIIDIREKIYSPEEAPRKFNIRLAVSDRNSAR